MNKTRIGVIGVGYLGRFHAQKYAVMESVELVGVTDIDKVRAQEVAADLNVRIFDNCHDLLSMVDAVSIVVPTSRHHQVALDCLEQGVDIFIEKPITTTLEEADAIIAKAELCNRIVQVGHIEQFVQS